MERALQPHRFLETELVPGAAAARSMDRAKAAARKAGRVAEDRAAFKAALAANRTLASAVAEKRKKTDAKTNALLGDMGVLRR